MAAGGAVNLRRILDAVLFFFMKLNSPVFFRELTVTFRKKKFFFTWTISMLVIGGAVFSVILVSTGAESNTVGFLISRWFLGLLGILIVVAAPSFTAASITGERESKTYTLLECAPMSTWEIIYGKFISGVTYILVFLSGSLPFLMISFLYGGVDFFDLSLAFSVLFLISMLQVILSIAISSAVGTTRSAQALSVICSIGLLVFLVSNKECRDFFSGTQLVLGQTGWDIFLNYCDYLIAYLVFFSMFFIVALNRLSPSSHNKATLPRLWALGVLLMNMLYLNVDFFRDAYVMNQGAAQAGLTWWESVRDGMGALAKSDWVRHLKDTAGVSGYAVALAAVFLCTGGITPSRRVRIWMRKHQLISYLLWPFMPGQTRAVFYVVVFVMLGLTVGFYPLRFCSDPALLYSGKIILAVLGGFALFAGAVGRIFSVLFQRVWVRRVFSTLVFLLILPGVVILMWVFSTYPDFQEKIALLSPVAITRATAEHGPAFFKIGFLEGGWITAGVYTLAALGLFFLAWRLNLRKNEKIETV